MQEYRRYAQLMGSAFEFVVATSGGADAAGRLLDDCVAEVQRIEALLTEHDKRSDTARIVDQAGRAPVTVAPETYALLQRCLDLSRLSRGAFDITAVVFKQIYRFDRQSAGLPEPAAIRARLAQTGYDKIELLPEHRVLLKKTGMRLGFGAIGKGYAADRVRAMLQARGVQSGVVNASGDLCLWGLRPDGQPRHIGIPHPDQPERLLLHLPAPAAGMCLATSGDAEQFFEHRGRRYAHTIDPRTGWPVTGVKTATVFSPSAELSDALATVVSVLGAAEGIALLNTLPDTHGVALDHQNRLFTTQHLQLRSYDPMSA